MFEAGQRVKVLVDKAFNGARNVSGREGTVLHNASSSDVVAYVKLDGANTDERYVLGARVACEVFGNEQLELVEPKTKKTSQKISVDEVQVGDEIVAFFESEGVEYRQKGVAHGKDWEGDWCTSEGGYLTYFDSPDERAQNIYLLNRPEPDPLADWEKELLGIPCTPEPKKPEIEDGVYYVTCAMKGVDPWRVSVVGGVADWKYGEDWVYQAYGDYKTLVKAKTDSRSGLTFHTEDPTPKGFAALDKTKTYFLKDKTGGLDWYLAYAEGAWKYGPREEKTRTVADFVEDWFTKGTDAWEKPVELVEPELTDLEKFERAGYVGKKFDGGPIYKVTRKGNVKYKAPSGVWENSFHSADTFLEDIKDGLVVGI